MFCFTNFLSFPEMLIHSLNIPKTPLNNKKTLHYESLKKTAYILIESTVTLSSFGVDVSINVTEWKIW